MPDYAMRHLSPTAWNPQSLEIQMVKVTWNAFAIVTENGSTMG
jgi:hypothetical protein